MTHPLTEASQHAKYFTKVMKRLVSRTISGLRHSYNRYTQTLDEINDTYEISIESSLSSSWPIQASRLSQLDDSLKSAQEICWSREEAMQCYQSLAEACAVLANGWEDLSEKSKHITCQNEYSPPKNRYVSRCASEKRSIDDQYIPDITSCQERYQNMVQALNSLQISRFSLNLSRFQIQLFSVDMRRPNSQDQEGAWDEVVKDVEWVGIDFSQIPVGLNLENCSFTQCGFGGNTYITSKWKNVFFSDCTGSLLLKESEASFSTRKCRFSLIDLNDTRVESMLLGDHTDVSHLRVHNDASVSSITSKDSKCMWLEVFSGEDTTITASNSEFQTVRIEREGSKHLSCALSFENTMSRFLILDKVSAKSVESRLSQFKLMAKESPIGRLSLTDSRVNVSLVSSDIEVFQSERSTVSAEADSSHIGNQTWDQSSAWMVVKNDRASSRKVFAVKSGTSEKHQIDIDQECVVVFSQDKIRRSHHPEDTYCTRMGRILDSMKINPDTWLDLDDDEYLSSFRYNQVLWLLKHGIPTTESYLRALIEQGNKGSRFDKREIFEKPLTEVFLHHLTSKMVSNPSSSSVSVSEMQDGDSEYIWQSLQDTDFSRPAPQSRIRQTSSDLDVTFFRHFMDTISKLDELSGGKPLERRLSLIKRNVTTMLSRHLVFHEINLELITNILRDVLKIHGSRKSSLRTSSDVVINYLVHIATWYLSLRLKTDDFSNHIKTVLLHCAVSKVRDPLLESISNSLEGKSSLIACQDIQKKVQTNRFSPYSREHLKALEEIPWNTISTRALDDDYQRIVLKNVQDILSSYRPVFPLWGPGRLKLSAIRNLLVLIRDETARPHARAATLFRHIGFLLGENQSRDSSPLFGEYASLRTGRSRGGIKGYEATLMLAKHMLMTVISGKSFHYPGFERCRSARQSFVEGSGPSGKIRHLVNTKARETLQGTISRLQEAVKVHKSDVLSTIDIEPDHHMNIDDQLAISRDLVSKSSSVSDWTDEEIRKLLILWYCCENRENHSIQKVSKVSLQHGLWMKHYYAEEEAQFSDRVGSSSTDHIEMVPLKGKSSSSMPNRSGEVFVRRIGSLLGTPINAKKTIFASEAKRVSDGKKAISMPN